MENENLREGCAMQKEITGSNQGAGQACSIQSTRYPIEISPQIDISVH